MSSTIGSSNNMRDRLDAILQQPSNKVCCDCSDSKPAWVCIIYPPAKAPPESEMIGGLCCFNCCGLHKKRLATKNIGYVRSAKIEKLTIQEIRALEYGGNAVMNMVFEAKKSQAQKNKISPDAELPQREKYIVAKYDKCKYYEDEAMLKHCHDWDNKEKFERLQKENDMKKEGTKEEDMSSPRGNERLKAGRTHSPKSPLDMEAMLSSNSNERGTSNEESISALDLDYDIGDLGYGDIQNNRSAANLSKLGKQCLTRVSRRSSISREKNQIEPVNGDCRSSTSIRRRSIGTSSEGVAGVTGTTQHPPQRQRRLSIGQRGQSAVAAAAPQRRLSIGQRNCDNDTYYNASDQAAANLKCMSSRRRMSIGRTNSNDVSRETHQRGPPRRRMSMGRNGENDCNNPREAPQRHSSGRRMSIGRGEDDRNSPGEGSQRQSSGRRMSIGSSVNPSNNGSRSFSSHGEQDRPQRTSSGRRMSNGRENNDNDEGKMIPQRHSFHSRTELAQGRSGRNNSKHNSFHSRTELMRQKSGGSTTRPSNGERNETFEKGNRSNRTKRFAQQSFSLRNIHQDGDRKKCEMSMNEQMSSSDHSIRYNESEASLNQYSKMNGDKSRRESTSSRKQRRGSVGMS